MDFLTKHLGGALEGVLGVALVLIVPALLAALWGVIKHALFGYDVQALLAKKDEGELCGALSHRRKLPNDEIGHVRSNAAIALGQIGGLGAIASLAGALSDRDALVAQAAAQGIAQITQRCLRQPMQEASRTGDAAKVRALLGSLEQVRARAVTGLAVLARSSQDPRTVFMALGMLGGDPAFTVLAGAVQSGSGEFGVVALQALLATGDPRVLEVLIGALGARDAALRAFSAELVAQLGLQPAAPRIRPLLRDGHASVRRAAVAALAKLGDAEFQVGLGDADAGTRAAAAKLAGQHRLRSAAPALLALARDEAPAVRSAALEALVALEDPGALELLLAALDDPSTDTCKQALALLGKYREPRVAERLIAFLGECFHLRGETAKALAAVGRGEWAAWIEGSDAAKDLRALASSGRPEAVAPVLATLLTRSDAYLCEQVLEAIAGHGRPPFAPLLAPFLVHVRKEFRGLAAKGLARCGDERWQAWVTGDHADLRRLVESKDPDAIALVLRGGGLDPARYRRGYSSGAHYDDEVIAAVLPAVGKLQQEEVTTFFHALLDLEHVQRPFVIAAAHALADRGDRRGLDLLLGAVKAQRSSPADLTLACAELALRFAPAAEWPDVRQRLRDQLVGGRPTERRPAAEALARFGEPQWVACLAPSPQRGDLGIDTDELVQLSRGGLVEATRTLIGRLADSDRATRQAAARGLIALASRPDAELLSAWAKVHELVTQPEGSSYDDNGRSSDCVIHETRQWGIGLAFPTKPGTVS